MAQTFDADELIEAARQATGLERFDSESFREGLGVLLADANRVHYPEMGVQRFRGAIIGSLATRLKTTAYLEQRPELLERPIERPVFVLRHSAYRHDAPQQLAGCRSGAPLAAHLGNRRSRAASHHGDAVQRSAGARAAGCRSASSLPPGPRWGSTIAFSAIYPNECMFFIHSDFKALMWEGRGKLPNYRDWLFHDADLTSTYQYHKRFLQLLQADAPGIWSLKQPSHGLWIDTLLKVYPDARLVWAHRDPIAATGSFCSLMRMGHSAFGLQPDIAWLAENYPWQAVEHANRIMSARERLGHDRIIDVHYADLMRDPLQTMRALYRSLGDDFSAAAENAMRAWLADNPQGKFGKHEYALEQFGLTAEQVRSMFEPYLSRYEVEAEG